MPHQNTKPKKCASLYISFFLTVIFFQGFSQPDLSKLYLPLGTTINRKNFLVGNYSDMQNPFGNVDSTKVDVNQKKMLELSILNNENDYAKIFSLDIKLNGHWVFVKGNDEFHKYSEQHFHSNVTRIYFAGNIAYGDQFLNKAHLNQRASNLMRTNFLRFAQTYGDYYVSHTRLLKKIFVFLDVTNMNGSDIQNLSGTHRGDVDAGFWSVGTDVQVRKNITTSYRNGNCHISVESFGLFEDSLVNQIITSIDLEKSSGDFDLLKSLSKAFFSILSNDANPVHYFNETVQLSDLVPFGMNQSYYTNMGLAADRYDDLNIHYSELLRNKNDFKTLMNDPFFTKTASDQEITSIHQSYDLLERDIFKLSQLKENCILNCSGSDLFNCCSFRNPVYHGSQVFDKYWSLYKKLNYTFNFSKTFVSPVDSVDLVDINMPTLKSKKVQLIYRYAYNDPRVPNVWCPTLWVHSLLLANEQVLPFDFDSGGWPPSSDTEIDPEGIIFPARSLFKVFVSQPFIVTENRLKVRLKVDQFRNNVGLAVPRLVQQSTLKVVLLDTD